VYFVQVGDNGPIKIGKAVSPLARLAELQTGNPIELIPRLLLLGGRHERFLHRRFKDCRIRGEWFRPRQHLRDFIALHVGLSSSHVVIGNHAVPVARLAVLKQRKLGLWEYWPDEDLSEELERLSPLASVIFGLSPFATFSVDTAATNSSASAYACC
jgi:hypothetical protein